MTSESAPEKSFTGTFQSAAAADGNGTSVNADGYAGPKLVEIQKTGTGTTALGIQGSFDGGTTWYAVGYQRIDAVASPARAVIAFVVGAGAINAVLQVLDVYPLYRGVLSTTSGTVALTAKLYELPVS